MSNTDNRSAHRDGVSATSRDAGSATSRDGGGVNATRRDGEFAARREFGIVLPDYLDREYVVVDDLSNGAEATVAVVQHRDTGQCKVIKIYRQGIVLPRSFIDKLRSADPRHVLPVERSVYEGWATPRFIEMMDFLPGRSLEERLRGSPHGLPSEARQILVEMTDALDYVHDGLKMVHRDIKPANILIQQESPLDLVLADLGIATELDEIARSRRETTGSVKGTPVYQSPETLNSSDAGRARDWWALGMTMCEVLTGQHPFKDSSGNPLSDHGRIRTAIVMGEIDLSIVADERWNLLCRGLLTHHPRDRWGADQVRAWLDGETPKVVSSEPPMQPAQSGAKFQFAGRSFTDPVELADHMVTNWDKAIDLFTSTPECNALRSWVREDLRDNTVPANLLATVGGNSALLDARIIAFTSHYRGPSDVRLRGTRITSTDLALQFLRAGDGWNDDALLKLLHPKVMDALVESQFDDSADQSGQSPEYRALVRLSRNAADVDREIAAAAAKVEDASRTQVAGVDVGADVRSAMPRRVERAQAVARAAMLSQSVLDELRMEFERKEKSQPAWFSDLCAQVGEPKVDSPASIARLALAVGIFDLADLYVKASAAARAAAERRRRDEAVAKEEEEKRAARSERRRVGLIAVCGSLACLVGVFAHVWLAPRFGWQSRDKWMQRGHDLLNWPSAEVQEVLLGIGVAALGALALAAFLSAVDIKQLRMAIYAACGVGGVFLLPLVVVLVAFLVMVALAIAAAALVLAIIGGAIAAGMGG